MAISVSFYNIFFFKSAVNIKCVIHCTWLFVNRTFIFKALYFQSWAVFIYIVFKYIYCIYTLDLNTFFNLYLITVFKYFWSVFKYFWSVFKYFWNVFKCMYLNTFLNTFLHTPLNINNRSSVDWSANHGFKHFNAVTCCICLLLNNTVLYQLICYISQLKKFI